MEEYYYEAYPRVLYNPNGQIMVVQSREEQQIVGAGWYESPAEYGVETCPAAPQAMEGGYYGVGYAAPSTAESPSHPIASPPGTPTHPIAPGGPGTPTHPIEPPPAPTHPTAPPPEAQQEMRRLEEEAARTRRRS